MVLVVVNGLRTTIWVSHLGEPTLRVSPCATYFGVCCQCWVGLSVEGDDAFANGGGKQALFFRKPSLYCSIAPVANVQVRVQFDERLSLSVPTVSLNLASSSSIHPQNPPFKLPNHCTCLVCFDLVPFEELYTLLQVLTPSPRRTPGPANACTDT